MNYVYYMHKYISFYCEFHEEQSSLPITERQRPITPLQEGSISYRYLSFDYSDCTHIPVLYKYR
jgi:hypothetical protein